MNRFAPLAAAAIVLAAIAPFMIPGKGGPVAPAGAALPANVIMAPEGGRLDALDAKGNVLGPCVLKHTDVQAEISGRFARVTVRQEYHNPHADKIEAVYTFPLSERSGVDRMTMTIGDRVIVGEVKERQQARRIYEQARAMGRTASLLEQERPNIFTQSVANIDPGATVIIELSYVEVVPERDGEMVFSFPTVVSPRYIPGSGASPRPERDRGQASAANRRPGVVLLAPATVVRAKRHDAGSERTQEMLGRMLAASEPIERPDDVLPDPKAADPVAARANIPLVWYDFTVSYPDGSKESGILLADGRGAVAGRWFKGPVDLPPAGEAFAQPTDKVPDADRITPMPVRPGVRAGHDISVSVTLDTGGPGIMVTETPLHKTNRTDLARNADGLPRRVSIGLIDLEEIPNRDFVLKWKEAPGAIRQHVFTNTGEHGNFFAVQLDTPPNVEDAVAVPRELIFVVDTSGSMNGKPIELAKTTMNKALDAMRPQDSFNIITFAGATRVMWERPRPNTTANRAEAQEFVKTWDGAGGTEMMTAINAALRQDPEAGKGATATPEELANMPADGRAVSVVVSDAQLDSSRLEKGGMLIEPTLEVRKGLSLRATSFVLPEAYRKRATTANGDDNVELKLMLRGVWDTVGGERVLRIATAEMYSDSGVRPLRIVMFLTDAEVGNDFEIIDAIKKNRATTRVFPFGIGNSVNRFLIEQMAAVGGGEPEYVYATTASDADAHFAIERFNRRTKTPVLTDISVTFNGVQPLDVLPAIDNIPDLFDNRPLTFIGRYTTPGTGSVTIRGQTAAGKWERTIPLTLPEREPGNSSLATLWARAKIDALMSRDMIGIQRGQPDAEVRAEIIRTGETFGVMSQYTSFVAVDKLRVTIDGKARLIHVPIELPDQTNWKGYFGELPGLEEAERARSHRRGMETKELAKVQLREEALGQLVRSVNGRTDAEHDEGRKTNSEVIERARAGTRQKLLPMSREKMEAKMMADPALAPPPSSATPTGGYAVGAESTLETRFADDFYVAGDGRRTYASSGLQYRYNLNSRDSGVAPDGNTALNGMIFNGAVLPLGTAGMPAQSGADYNRDGALNSADIMAYVDAWFDGTVGTSQPAAVPPSQLMDFPLDWPAKTWARGDAPRELSPVGALGNSLGLTTSLSEADFAKRATALLPVSGCMETIAAAQLADAGRIDEAKQVACGGAAALASSSKSVSNVADPKWAVEQSSAQPPISRICGALNSSLPEVEKKAAIDEARLQAATVLLEVRRRATIVRRIAPALLSRIEEQRMPATAAVALSTGAPASPGAVKEASAKLEAATKDAGSMKAARASKDRAAPVGAASVSREQPPVASPAPTAIAPAGPTTLLVAILVSDTSARTLEVLKERGLVVVQVKAEANVVVGRIAPDKLEELALTEQVKRIDPVDE